MCIVSDASKSSQVALRETIMFMHPEPYTIVILTCLDYQAMHGQTKMTLEEQGSNKT